ncbi:MAG: 2-amino-4-hydroxy-6-hydroxymethyldihydropteridine diphosphokinase [Synechococcaceae cyanobacterium]|nr:2-amino-4-hydroxy-6-hydroxymethyldihydropteridine diphosphokinase [Synechococcaceae cyanobacterium]
MPSLSLAIGLGANLGDPLLTLTAVRPQLAALFDAQLRLRWSPLFRTAPVGGPPDQPDYLNAVLLVETPAAMPPSPPSPPPATPSTPSAPDPAGEAAARAESPASRWPEPQALLQRMQELELRFGRRRREHWGPRLLDLDLLWCAPHRCDSPELTLPHPLLTQRTFVLAPLLAIDPALRLPSAALPSPGASPQPLRPLLEHLLPQRPEPAPERLPPQPGWPE